MDDNDDHFSWWGVIIGAAILWSIGAFLFGGKDDEDYTPPPVSGSYHSSYSSSDYEESEEFEPDNPYSYGSGHSAGFEWAEENDVDSCGGNSDSFVEGCEEYLSQKEESEDY